MTKLKEWRRRIEEMNDVELMWFVWAILFGGFVIGVILATLIREM